MGAPLLDEPRYLTPVLATFVHALPVAYQETAAPEGTVVALAITGPAGGDWVVRRAAGGWRLYAGAAEGASCRVALPAGVAWRLFTRGLAPEAGRARAIVTGDADLAAPLFAAVAIIA